MERNKTQVPKSEKEPIQDAFLPFHIRRAVNRGDEVCHPHLTTHENLSFMYSANIPQKQAANRCSYIRSNY